MANSHPDLFRTSNHFGCLLHAYPMDGTPQHALFKEKVKGEIRVSAVTSAGSREKSGKIRMICGKGPFFWNLPQPREKQFRKLGGGSDDDESICNISIYLPKSSYRDGSLRASVTINEKYFDN